ncbi:MAG: hypothetical protein A2W28_03740 [Gammaproteobacteria bacterium RBG_16_51_14]|nr:MAG: hypothetical protein A2W28_03740 [Gammaproteobacteria bacterium RBG_16_51_14]
MEGGDRATQDAYRDIGDRKRRELVFETKPKQESRNELLDSASYPQGTRVRNDIHKDALLQ